MIHLTAKQKKFFRHARNMAKMSSYKRSPTGCVAVVGGKVVATGFNQNKTHPVQQRFSDIIPGNKFIAKLHAEVAMVTSSRHLGIDWSKADVYIYRICKARPTGISKPCKVCMAVLLSVGVRNIYFTTDEEDKYGHIRIDEKYITNTEVENG